MRLFVMLFKSLPRLSNFLFSCKACVSLPPVHYTQQVIQTGAIRGYKRHVPALLRELYRRKKKEGPKALTPRRDFLEWNYEAELFAFGARLGEKFNTDFLKQSFLTPGYCEKEKERQKELGMDCIDEISDNQALYEEGKSLASSYIKSYLRQQLPFYPEEGISALHNFLLTDATLADIALHLGVKELVLATEYPPSQQDMASALLAVIGCLDKSSGKNRTETFLRDCIISYLSGKDINEYFSIKDPMGVLRDILKRSDKSPPEPRITRESGTSTILATYFVAIYSDKQFLAEGCGETVDIAIEMAAREALKTMFRSTEGSVIFSFGSTSTNSECNPSLMEWKFYQ